MFTMCTRCRRNKRNDRNGKNEKKEREMEGESEGVREKEGKQNDINPKPLSVFERVHNII